MTDPAPQTSTASPSPAADPAADPATSRAASPVVAAIDCGTNTIKLLIGRFSLDGSSEELVRTSRMVRLGQGVDISGELAQEALDRAWVALEEYAALINEHGATQIRFCATSATRDSRNAADFSDGVHARLGVRPEVLSGDEEAMLAFDGAVRNLTVPLDSPTLVIDIGGGSTELILGEREPEVGFSMNVGSVRLHERRLHTDPADTEEIAACVADIEAAIDEAEAAGVDLSRVASVVGIAGTITSIGAGVLGLESYDAQVVDQSVLPVPAVRTFIAELVAMTLKQRLALGWMHPGRADVIDAGALILDRVLARVSATQMVVSEADILDGIAWSMAT